MVKIFKTKEKSRESLFQNFIDEVVPKSLDKETDLKVLKSIKKKFQVLIKPFIKTSGISKNKIKFLEIGCGDGKYAFFISKHVKEYSGVDLREKSLEKAKEILKFKENCYLYLNDGKTLKQIPKNSQHLVFSYQTFIYFTDKLIIESYLKETFRILKDNGFAKIQISGPSMRKGLRISWLSLGRFRRAWRIFNFLPGTFQIPILRYDYPKTNWGKWGAFYNPTEALKFINELGGKAFVKPCLYESPYHNNDMELYWLYITKKKSKVFEVSVG